MISSFPWPDVPAGLACRGDVEQDARPLADFAFRRDVTLFLLSQDEQDATLVRRLLAPSRLTESLVWHRHLRDARLLSSSRGAPVCILVGSTPVGQSLSDVVRWIRRRAPRAAVLLLGGTNKQTATKPHVGITPLAGWVQGWVDHRRTAPHEFRREIWLALQRAHRDTAPVTVRVEELIAQDSALLERGLLPDVTLRGDGFTTGLHYAPGRSHALLGGDFCDVVQAEDSTVHVVMGDVSGHGAAEAALAVHLRLAWRTAVLCGQSQLGQLRLLERILVDERPDEDTYATVVSLVFPPHGRSIRMVSAGHPGLLHRHSGKVSWVEPQPGIALGLFPGRGDWSETEMALADRDSVVLFTDGLYEGRTAGGRLGEEGLLRLAAQYAHLEPQAFVDALVRGASLLAAPFGGLLDDVAVLHLGWNRPGRV
ncbi:MAG: serine/threonine-protein phosphatase [Streptomyces sp.]|nr:serine/threonine-protein phosphatase [Streptomyces sp.]